MPSPAWLPWAVAVGVLAHIAGDALTTQGIPVPLVWILHRCRLKLLPLDTGTSLEKIILAPLCLIAALTLGYVNTGAQAALDPLIDSFATGP